MRTLVLAIIALSGMTVFPTAALAGSFSGVCTLAGSASLSPALGGTLPKLGSFTFSTDGSSINHCTGKLNGANVINAPASAIATGGGRLSCVASKGDGSGTLTISGVPIAFKLTIVGTGPQVTLDIQGKGGGVATGQASFATDGAAAGECVANNAGNLTFVIAATAANLH